MSTDVEGGAIIESKAALIAHLASGCKPKSQWRIGTEHEKFVFRRKTNTPVAYDGPDGIRTILERLTAFDWKPVIDEGNIIGLTRNGASVSLEPGGQFELSGAPLQNIHETCREVGGHLSEIRAVCENLNIGFLGLGFTPDWKYDDIPLMPKPRYKLMREYMPKVGTMGRDMMFRTCTVQANMDFSSEADMIKKFRVSLALQPIATALFANSPFTEGKPNGFLSFRSQIWTDTDNARAGMLPFVFEDDFNFERYVEYALDVPMYFVKRGGHYVDATGRNFRKFMDGKLEVLPGERPTEQDWVSHLSTIFPEVRLKTFLEMRGADSGPWSRICALPAFWTGILYNQAALDAAWDLVKDWTAEERQALRDGAPRLALNTPFRNGKLQDVAIRAVAIAREGLKARGKELSLEKDETQFIDELSEIAETGITAAERLLEHYHTAWGGDVSKAYTCCAF